MNLRRLILLALLWPACASASQRLPNPKKLVGKAMPAVRGTTLRGTRVDSSFFGGKVTLLNFMYIGCRPCMAEIPMLQALQRRYASDPAFQILAIAPHTAGQLRDFYARNGSVFSRTRQYLHLDSVTYEQLPACAQAQIRDTLMIGPECATIAQDFYLDGYPLTVLIDKKGVVRAVEDGFTATADHPAAAALAEKWRVSIETLLRK